MQNILLLLESFLRSQLSFMNDLPIFLPFRFQGEKGERGTDGPRGQKGDPGPIEFVNATVPEAPRGDIGTPGRAGIAGEPGPKGFPGPKGQTGPTGAKVID